MSTIRDIRPHNEVSSTSCPGSNLEHRIKAIMRHANRKIENRSWFDMATEKELEQVVERVLESKVDEIADRAVDKFLSRKDAVIGRNYASILRSPARLDELANPHPNDLPSVLDRIEKKD